MAKKTKADRDAKKLAHQQSRANVQNILLSLKGKTINTITANEKEKLLIVVCDFLGISESGIVQ